MNTNLEAVGGEVGQDGEHEQRTRPREEHHVRVQLARLRARLSHQLQLPRVGRRAERVHFLRTPLKQNNQKSTPTAHLRLSFTLFVLCYRLAALFFNETTQNQTLSWAYFSLAQAPTSRTARRNKRGTRIYRIFRMSNCTIGKTAHRYINPFETRSLKDFQFSFFLTPDI